MYYVYILKSVKFKYFYIGLTQDIDKRIMTHNLGRNRSTKAFRPFELIFVQVLDSRKKARDLEKYLKIRSNKEKFLDIIKPRWRNWQTLRT